ncbi:hypothetical protein Pint_31448 [Pistacia integerrima]|uniref:Uncharacterized protein n=1 Tax=Pistacia integerrima TaxID=434235 RepID=A0ACC0XRD1_9ROSI|nr:hypothetical protein Pint_31448 [Pistacia integerrima]
MKDLLFVKMLHLLVFASEKPDSKSDEEWEFEHKQSGVLNEEVRRRTQGSSSSHSKVLVTENKGRNKGKGQGENGRGKSRSKSRSKYKNLECHYCDFFILDDDDVINVACHKTSWVIDNGASIHTTSRKDLFTSYVVGDFGTVKIDNNGLAKVIGIRDVCLEMDNGSSLLLRDVNHIPDIRLNLISTGRLEDEGYYNTFSDG